MSVYLNARNRVKQRAEKVALQIHNTSLVFEVNSTAIIDQGDEHLWQSFYVDKVKTEVNYNDKKFFYPAGSGCKVKVTRPSIHHYRVVISEMQFTLVVRINQQKLITKIKVKDTHCCNTVQGGYCGECSGCTPSASCDLYHNATLGTNSTGTPSTPTTNQQEEPDCTFDMTSNTNCVDMTGMGPGNAIFFNDSSVITERLRVVKGKQLTIEFFVKTFSQPSCYGTMLSYAKHETFSINHEGNITLNFGTSSIDTGLSLDDNQWNQISLAVDRKRSTRTFQLYVFNSTGFIKMQNWNFTGRDPFPIGGDFVLGRSQPPRNGDNVPLSNLKFVGSIDELRIWDR